MANMDADNLDSIFGAKFDEERRCKVVQAMRNDVNFERNVNEFILARDPTLGKEPLRVLREKMYLQLSLQADQEKLGEITAATRPLPRKKS